jgi:hypothetical protein
LIPSPGDWWRDFLLFGFGFLVLLRKQGGWLVVAVAFAVCLLRWHPRDVIGSRVLPLCGAAPTFLCRRKEK